MFGIGGFELILILIFGFLVFGPEKLPEIAKTVGKGIAKFRTAQEEMSEQLKGATFIDKDSDEPFKDPLKVIENATASAKEKSAVVKENVSEVAAAATKTAAAAQEGFAERKARYDAERKAKREAAAKAEAEAAKPSVPEREPQDDVEGKTIVEESD